MARSKIPEPLKRRHLVERHLAPPQALAIAEAYLEAERYVEAADFLRKAEAGERLAELRAQAIEGGDLFLLRRVAAAMGEAPSRDEFRRVAERARAEGLERYAEEAGRMAERHDEESGQGG